MQQTLGSELHIRHTWQRQIQMGITFNENLWRANKVVLILVHLFLLLCQSFKDLAGECLSEAAGNMTDQY